MGERVEGGRRREGRWEGKGWERVKGKRRGKEESEEGRVGRG